ncbi:MAG TPA: hypothetical protein VJV79_26140 [Polyangiaceae bacterium]|nr:hypothetical protein [Polyangiaceae bacterium]
MIGRSRRVAWLSSLGLLVLATGPLSSCSSGTETGNPTFQAELSYTAFSSAPSQVGLSASASAAVVESAWLDLDTVGLFRAGSCNAAQRMALSVPALGVGDHAAGNHNATRFELNAGFYCGLDLPFVRAAASDLAGAPAVLADHSILIEGALADGTPFQILSSATPTVRLTADADIFALDAAAARTLIAFDIAVWLSDLDFASAARTGDAIMISASENPDLLAQFERNLAGGVALYRDDDGDGKLDAVPVRLAHAE